MGTAIMLTPLRVFIKGGFVATASLVIAAALPP